MAIDILFDDAHVSAVPVDDVEQLDDVLRVNTLQRSELVKKPVVLSAFLDEFDGDATIEIRVGVNLNRSDATAGPGPGRDESRQGCQFSPVDDLDGVLCGCSW